MARTLKINQAAVFQWVHKNRVPSKQIPVIIKAARDLNPPIDLEPNDFFQLGDAPNAAKSVE